MNDYKELLAELRKCKYCAKDVAKYAADAIEQLVAEYNELVKAHGELFIEYHKVKKQRDADAVKVVRCRDCKHWHKDTVFCGYMSYGEASERVNWYADDFCSYGERKDGVD